MKAKAWMRIIISFLFILVICSYVNVSSSETPGSFVEAIAESLPSNFTTSLTVFQPLFCFMDAVENKNSQSLRLYFTAKQKSTGRLCGLKRVLHTEQEITRGTYYSSADYWFIIAAVSEKKHVSVLALSLGGNSPPVFYA